MAKVNSNFEIFFKIFSNFISIFSDYALKKVVVKNLNVEVTVPDILASKANLNL